MKSCMIVIFGATGDLNKRMLIPALYNLYCKGQLGSKPIVCVGRRDLSRQEFIQSLNLKESMPVDEKLEGFRKLIYYHRLDFDAKDFSDFAMFISKKDEEYGCKASRIFYLATPASLFVPSVKIIHSSGLLNGKGSQRIVFEKPFGYDLASARKLNQQISKCFNEENIYRIDHYLGKELVQNILVLRFANSVFEQIWSSEFIDHIEITVAETVGVEKRGNYYDKAGAIRDLIQNHLLQLVSLAAMEPPKTMSAEDISEEKVKVLRALQRLKPSELVVGQYAAGAVDGKKVKAYRQEENVDPRSNTETYAALKLHISNERWKGVPFYIRTGKSLTKKHAELRLVLKEVACKLFFKECPEKNLVTIRIHPDEGIALRFNAKYPGVGLKLHPATMEFCHACEFGENTPQAYERLLYDVIAGDKTLFTRWDWVEASWRYVDPILRMRQKRSVSTYKAGSMGPNEADRLLKKDGGEWVVPKE